MNRVELMGRLSKDPEIRVGKDKCTCATFSIAEKNVFNDSVDFFSIVAFGRVAELCEKYLHKGLQIIVCGRLQNKQWKNKEGHTMYGMDIIISELFFTDTKRVDELSENAEAKMEQADLGDELPF
jgi:single-strand DNA-binding protein